MAGTYADHGYYGTSSEHGKHGSIRYEELTVSQLRKSPGNKRAFNERRARAYAAELDEFRLGVISVSWRDGAYWVIDGWHRVGSCRLAGREKVRALVHVGLTVADEAREFDKQNTDRVRISAGDEFWARIDYHEPNAMAVLNICRSAGIRILTPGASGSAPGVNSPGDTKAFSALQATCLRFGETVLRDTLMTLRDAWPDEPRALGSAPLVWVSSFIATYSRHPNFDRASLVGAMQRVNFMTVLQRIQGMSGARGAMTKGSASSTKYGSASARSVFLDLYNWRRRRPLPPVGMSELTRLSRGQNPWE